MGKLNVEKELSLEEVIEGKLPGLITLKFCEEKGALRVRMDFVDKVLREMRWVPKGGMRIRFRLSDREEELKDCDFYGWARVYKVSEEEEWVKHHLSIGGLQCIIYVKGTKLEVSKGEKVYIGMKLVDRRA